MNFFKPKFWDRINISPFAILLIPISLIIKMLSLLRKSVTKTYKFSIPVICVGNIYLGGTGKTPLCIELFSILKSLNMDPVFIRKRYTSFQDEVELQKQKGPVYQNKKRIIAVQNAVRDGANVVILDDGFQDFSINKDLSIVCFNEKQWIGNGLTIPSGPLRESLSALKRANCVIINGEKNVRIEKKILEKNSNIKIFYTKYIPKNINEFQNKKIVAFAGIGNPENFFDLLEKNKIKTIENIRFPDHFNYSSKMLEDLSKKTKEKDAILLTTEKDYFRISSNYKKDINYLKILVKIQNQEKFIEEIKKII